MKFRLTYEGRLEGNGSPKHKHEIRKAFHPQLRRLWDVLPSLQQWTFPRPQGSKIPPVGLRNVITAAEALAEAYDRMGYNFVPLATEGMSIIASIDILFLRPDPPGAVIRSGDIDNRLKTLFDALKMPKAKAELGGYDAPTDDEKPFFVLLEDDKLISHVAVETDTLLEPTPSAAGQWLANDSRLVITVDLKPYARTIANDHFA